MGREEQFNYKNMVYRMLFFLFLISVYSCDAPSKEYEQSDVHVVEKNYENEAMDHNNNCIRIRGGNEFMDFTACGIRPLQYILDHEDGYFVCDSIIEDSIDFFIKKYRNFVRTNPTGEKSDHFVYRIVVSKNDSLMVAFNSKYYLYRDSVFILEGDFREYVYHSKYFSFDYLRQNYAPPASPTKNP